MSSPRITTIASTCLLAVLIGGCGLGSPYVKVPLAVGDNAYCGLDSCSLDEALRYSRATRDAYRAVLDRYAKLRNHTGQMILGIGAAALGFGIVKAHRDVFTTLGFVGATDYAYGKYNENPPREELFQQTVEALYCAEMEANKVRLVQSTKIEIERLQGAIVDGSAAVARAAARLAPVAANVQSAIKRAEDVMETAAAGSGEHLDANADHGALQERYDLAKAAIEGASAAREAGSKAHALGSARISAAENVGSRLALAVDKIVIATDREAKKTMPDPDSAFLIVKDLPGFAARFLPDADAIASLLTTAAGFRAEKSGDGNTSSAARSLIDGVDDAVWDLTVKTDALRSAVETLTALVGSSLGADPYQALDKCAIAGLADLSLEPPSTKLVAGTAQAIAIDASGGKKPYQSHFVGAQPADLLVTAPKSNESRFVMNVPAGLAPNVYKLAIVDATGRQATFTLTVEAASP